VASHRVEYERSSAVRDPLLPLASAGASFTWLVTPPQPLAVDGRFFQGMPNRRIPLDELRDRLIRHRGPSRNRDAVWAYLVRRSRREGATWALACVGMALPGLYGVARRLSSRFPGDPFDVQAEVLSGFLRGLNGVDLARPHVFPRLRWAAYRQGHASLVEALDAPTPMAGEFWSVPPRPPWGHPDLVLARAVRAGILHAGEADLIGATRLEEESVADWAVRHEMTSAAAYKARRRAEARLVEFLRDETGRSDLDDPVVAFALDHLPPSRTLTRRGGVPRSPGC